MKRKTSPVRKSGYTELIGDLTELLEEARRTAARSVNAVLTATYWKVGRRIVEFEQEGKTRAEYGARLLQLLSKDLTQRFGRGFSPDNLELMRRFYLVYPTEISETLSRKFPLSWSHYVRLFALDEPHKRDFYEEEAYRASWSVRQLDRQINSMLYERLALSRKKGELLHKAEQSVSPTTPEEEIKDPYILEFLGLPEPHSEKDLENALIQHLADFLLELGYGFTFVARQKRLQVGSESYYLDLLLYHRSLRCLVAIDLKVGNCAVVKNCPEAANINQDVALVRLRNGVHPYFFAAWFNSLVGKQLVEQRSTGGINPFLGLGNLRGMPFPVLTPKEHNRIGNLVQETVENAYAAERQASDLLEQAKHRVEELIEEGIG